MPRSSVSVCLKMLAMPTLTPVMDLSEPSHRLQSRKIGLIIVPMEGCRDPQVIFQIRSQHRKKRPLGVWIALDVALRDSEAVMPGALLYIAQALASDWRASRAPKAIHTGPHLAKPQKVAKETLSGRLQQGWNRHRERAFPV